MVEFEQLMARLVAPSASTGVFPLVDATAWLDREAGGEADATATVNAAFLLGLCGRALPLSERARAILASPPRGASAELVAGLRRALGRVQAEVSRTLESDASLRPALDGALAESARARDERAAAEALWTLFFPEGLGILGREEEQIAALRERRTVRVTELNPRPLADPAAEILFTSNVLLSVPAAGTDIEALPYPAWMRRKLGQAAASVQQRWYDHPIQIGVEPAANELLYGLRGLDEAVGFERRRNARIGRATVALSVSVTHDGLQAIARDYVREELARAGGLRNLDVYVFTEANTARLVAELLAPTLGADGDESLAAVFGVDGEYGRHYNFLKAIAALWHVLVDRRIRATFKIDLDQVFPQQALVAETGRSAFEHLTSPLWGARGVDAWGAPVELGMVAGALVNERDIGQGLFTPDVSLPGGPGSPDEYVFFSRLPQAVSTRAEMMERYDTARPDGRGSCLERVHVTGGTNGILLDALRRYRPFTPSFFGRAEDQAYILSVLTAARDGSPRLSYAHAGGLIMRHDKEAFAGAAIEAARGGKLVGDDVRILYFSAYAEILGREAAKRLSDPFTGCFMSRLPVSVVLLRFALRLAEAVERGDGRLAGELAGLGYPRIERAIDLVGDGRRFEHALERERDGWRLFYAAVERLDHASGGGDAESAALIARGRELLESCRASARS